MGPEPQGGSCEGEKVSTCWEVSSAAGRADWMEGEVQSLGGEHSNSFAEGKMERNLHRRSAPLPCDPQPKTLLCLLVQVRAGC